ncbi:hypothetical protein B0H17DRAFT_1209713 [Mycena rosella]|uniref:Uncharacterized protein n=1 Tax=Mycena rosella TaxID=1033263 RepID=A0AAD7CXV3_MYCRO|nr:hypothetical protein B0H17DRAFT_1209713 [Mycena rosella]
MHSAAPAFLVLAAAIKLAIILRARTVPAYIRPPTTVPYLVTMKAVPSRRASRAELAETRRAADSAARLDAGRIGAPQARFLRDARSTLESWVYWGLLHSREHTPLDGVTVLGSTRRLRVPPSQIHVLAPPAPPLAHKALSLGPTVLTARLKQQLSPVRPTACENLAPPFACCGRLYAHVPGQRPRRLHGSSYPRAGCPAADFNAARTPPAIPVLRLAYLGPSLPLGIRARRAPCPRRKDFGSSSSRGRGLLSELYATFLRSKVPPLSETVDAHPPAAKASPAGRTRLFVRVPFLTTHCALASPLETDIPRRCPLSSPTLCAHHWQRASDDVAARLSFDRVPFASHELLHVTGTSPIASLVTGFAGRGLPIEPFSRSPRLWYTPG